MFNNGYLTEVPSGGDKHLLSLLPMWAGHSAVTVMLPSYAAPLVGDGPKVSSYPANPPRYLPQLVLGYLYRTFRGLGVASRTPASLVFSSPGLFDLLPALWHRRRHGSRVGVFLFHIPSPGKLEGRWMHRWVAGVAHRLSLRWLASADCIFVGNSEVFRELAERGFDRQRLTIQPPAVDPEAILSATPEPGPQVLFIGRLVAQKGVYDLIDVAGQLDLSFGLIGDGELRGELKKRIREEKLEERVQLFGGLPEARVYGLLLGCRCLILPSYQEGYALVVAEALIAGKPAVAYELPHYREIFGEALVTVPAGDTLALAEAVAAAVQQSAAPPWDSSRHAPTPRRAAEDCLAALQEPPRTPATPRQSAHHE